MAIVIKFDCIRFSSHTRTYTHIQVSLTVSRAFCNDVDESVYLLDRGVSLFARCDIRVAEPSVRMRRTRVRHANTQWHRQMTSLQCR